MTYETRPNTGALFKNKDKKSDKHPDWTGPLNIDGRELRIAVWCKTARSGVEYMSVAVSEPIESSAGEGAAVTDEEIPF